MAATQHPDLPAERAYVSHAYACLERMRELLERAGDAGATEVAAEALEAWAMARLQTFDDAERGLLFGRIDLDGAEKPLYVGRRWVHDGSHDVVAVNWQAPAARPYYTATPVDPQRVDLRRRFKTEGRDLLGIADERLGGSGGDATAAVDEFLLDELERSRTTRMRDIVATIQGDQYRLITRALEGILVIQGGPGTGKTAVALHRASWLLFTFRDRLRSGALMVGPNPAFMEYVSHVLPALGEESVVQRAVTELVDGVTAVRTDTAEVARVKGSPEMAERLRHAVERRLDPPDAELGAFVDGSFIRVRPEEVAEFVRETWRESGSLAGGRERLRMKLLRRFYERYGRALGGLATQSFDEIERALRKNGLLQRFVTAAWPTASADELVRGALAEAGLPRPKRGEWSDADLPLLDEARALVHGPEQTFGHVLVDEAQDLTPMQLRMIARRAPSGSLTILGDIAQATGPVAYGSWDELLAHLPAGTTEADVEELRYAYRVPRQIMELALPLLERIAPGAAPPIAYRDGDEEPSVVVTTEAGLVATALAEAARLAPLEGSVAVILPASLHAAVPEVPDLSVLTPREAKGLEFDRVVVVEPALIVEEGEELRGLRELYVALTRPTKTLVVVRSRPLPEPL